MWARNTLLRYTVEIFFTTLLLLFALSTPSARAQTATLEVPGQSTAFTITLSPENPAPGDSVTLTLSSPLYDLGQSTITWQANGKALTSGVGVKTATVVAGALGATTVVTASIEDASGNGTAQASITPSIVDLLWESDSYVPPFYPGRALPSAGSRVRLQAVPYLPKKGGGYYSASELSYTWKENGATISSASGRGSSSVTLSSPDLFGNYTVSVVASSPDGTVSGAADVQIESVEPNVVLYRDHPLFGVEYFSALPATTFIDDSEMTFAAVPFFENTSSPVASHLAYAWKVNGKSVPADDKQPNELTINAGTSGGLAHLALELTDRANILVDASGDWAVTFTAGGAGGGARASNLFHGTQ